MHVEWTRENGPTRSKNDDSPTMEVVLGSLLIVSGDFKLSLSHAQTAALKRLLRDASAVVA
jgi:hypothetical protein